MRPPRIHRPTYHIPRAQPAHHFVRANRRRPSSRPGRAWKPAPTACGVRRLTGNVISPAPTLHQPLSHGALRRDSSPFRGAEGWEDAWGVYALVCRDADTVVFLAPVRGGVLDAPRLRDCRGGGCGWSAWPIATAVDAARSLLSSAQRMRFRGHSPRTISCGRTDVVRHPRPGGRESPPLRCIGKVLACNRRLPSSGGGASGTPPLTGGLYTSRCGIQRAGTARAPFQTGVQRYPYTDAGRAWKPAPTGCARHTLVRVG